MSPKEATLLLFLFCVHQYCTAQVYFSQTGSSPLAVNPANTGRFDGDYRIGGIYRNEKAQQSNRSTASFYFDTKIFSSALRENDRLALGMTALSERIPYFGVSNNYYVLSLAYHKALNEDGTDLLSAGFQAGWSRRHLSPPGLVFEDQLIGGGFTGIGDARNDVDISYPDFSIGLHYKKAFREDDQLTAGISVFHVAHPYREVNNIVFSLPPELCVQAGWDCAIDDSNKWSNYALVNATPAGHTLNDLIISSTYQIKINDSDYWMHLGLSLRKNNRSGTALMPALCLAYNHFSLRFSYEFSLSKKPTDEQGAAEAALLYIGSRQ